MEYTNYQIVNMFNDLDNYAQKKMPQRISYAITKNLIILQREYMCYKKELDKLFDAYKDKSEKDDKGEVKMQDNGIPQVKQEYLEEFAKELNELLAIKVNVDLYIIPEDVFDYTDTNNRYDPLSPNDIVFLQTIICGQIVE